MNLQNYVRYPRPVEAFQWNGYNEKDLQWVIDIVGEGRTVYVDSDDCLKIEEDDLWITARVGDYVIKDINCEFNSYNAKDFEWTYKLSIE